jgi:hypothetical protein
MSASCTASPNTAWHHYAPSEPHAETSSIRTRWRLRNKMVSACKHAISCISTWTRSTRPWSSATTLSCGEGPSLSPGAGIVPSCALLPMKRESSACVPPCPLVRNVCAQTQSSWPRTSRAIGPCPAKFAKSSSWTQRWTHLGHCS